MEPDKTEVVAEDLNEVKQELAVADQGAQEKQTPLTSTKVAPKTANNRGKRDKKL